MLLQNHTYKQNKLVKRFISIYLLLIIGVSIFILFNDVDIPLFLILLNLPITFLLYFNFRNSIYIQIENDEFIVNNSAFKPIHFSVSELISIKRVGNNFTLLTSNKKEINLINFRISTKDKTKFKQQMKLLHDYLKSPLKED